MKKIKSIIGSVLILVFVLLAIGTQITETTIVDKKAIVFVDKNTNEFYCPLGLTEKMISDRSMNQTTMKEAETMGYKMNDDDRNNGYYSYESGSITRKIFEKLGIVSPVKPRVDNNGNWLY